MAPAAAPEGILLRVDGRDVVCPAEMANAPLAAFLKGKAGVKSVKVACGEGGCGACAVAVLEEKDGKTHLRTFNSCLAPVYALRGKAIVTAEGLPGGAASKVAEAFDTHHASQCGYCTPGFAIACHAALHNAAAAGACGGAGGCGNGSNGSTANGSNGHDGAKPVLDGEGLRQALDGNLCRCTGYRPIVAACKSLAGAVADIEDLGALPAPPAPAPPAAAADGGVEVLPLGHGQLLKAPHSLSALIAEAGALAAAADGKGGWRLVAGSTGHGVYKDWPVDECVLLSVSEVPELKRLDVAESEAGAVLAVGAGVTLEALASGLDGLAAAEAGGKGAAAGQWAAESAAHLRRIAGKHVRNSATVGGNLALAAERSLPSDVATVLGGAGATVELALITADKQTNGSIVRADLIDFLATRTACAVPTGASYIITAVHVPLPAAGSRFWSSRVAERYSNAAAVANAAVQAKLTADGSTVESVRIVYGARTPASTDKVVAAHNAAKTVNAAAVLLDGWVARRATAAEAALVGQPPSTAALATALAALTSSDLAAAGVPPSTAAVAEGLVAQGLAAALGLTAAAPSRLPPPPLVDGVSDLPAPVPELAPVSHPTGKIGAKLQASGTAHYTEDAPVHEGALFAALVTAARAGAELKGFDPSPALALPGVVRFLTAADLFPGPTGAGANAADRFPGTEPLLAPVPGRADFAGQPIGVVLASSPWMAARAAKAVVVQYGEVTDAVFTIEEALDKSLLYPIGLMASWMPKGSSLGPAMSLCVQGGAVEPALAAAGAPAAVTHGPAAAAAAKAAAAAAEGADKVAEKGAEAPAGPVVEVPAEGKALVEAAKEEEEARARGAADGGGGGGVDGAAGGKKRVVTGRYQTPSQLHFYMETQTAVAWPDEDGSVVVHSACQGTDFVQAAVSVALGLPLNKVAARCRRVGGGFGGKATFARRIACLAAAAAVATGRQVRLQLPRNLDLALHGGRCSTDVSYTAVVEEQEDGSAPKLAALDVHAVCQGGAYADISWLDPAALLSVIDGVYRIPNIRAEVALTRCSLPPRTTVRAPGDIQGTMIIEQILEHVAAECGVDPEQLRAANLLQPPAADPAEENPIIMTSLGKRIPSRLYTVPRMWRRLEVDAGWEALKAEVADFNASNPWTKRGVALVPARYGMWRGRKPAYVSILADGTIQVACYGIEMGQGLFTKVAQVAAHALGEALPASQRPLDMGLIKVMDNSSELLPNGGVTGGSTSSELSCASVRLACLKLAEGLKKQAEAKFADKPDYTWKELLTSTGGIMGATIALSAFAHGDPTDLPEAAGPDTPGPVEPDYSVFGVAGALVEVDVLTGERRVLRSDIVFDLGRPINSAIDLGQVEGAFVQGMGMMLAEKATYDPSYGGGLEQNSTWSYKPPAAACAPQQLNVTLLSDAPLIFNGPLSSKAVGEPPLLLSSAVLMALQRAANAARSTAATVLGNGNGATANHFQPLLAPATVERVRAACGGWSAAELFKASSA